MRKIPALKNNQLRKKKNIFSDPENLKILPENTTPDQLKATMKAFSLGLGLRCLDCHVGEKGSFDSYDFASDDKKLKRKARVMMDMVKNINTQQLPNLDEIEKNSRVSVECITCHRGQSKPILIQDILAEEQAKNGVKSVIDKYVELREKYYGSHTYDFSKSILSRFANDNLLKNNKTDDAIELLLENLKYYPKSFFAHFTLAKAYHKKGNSALALSEYKKAFTLNPKAIFVQKIISKLEKEPSQ